MIRERENAALPGLPILIGAIALIAFSIYEVIQGAREPSPAMIRSVSRYSWAELERSLVPRCRSVPGPPDPPERLMTPGQRHAAGAL